MNERLKLIRKNSGMTQEAFASELGATRGMIAKYETGLVVPDQTMRLLISQRFNVNPTWLETGEGKPYKEGLIPELVHALRQMPAVQTALERLLPRLTAEDLQHINALIEKFINDDTQKGAEE
nr:MAG TPA_asm: helix-turn-helix domain protein [Caudoviricetes sp.]